MDRKVYEAYMTQRDSAKSRGIGWGFTEDTWLEKWESSGHLHERGKKGNEYCMARNGDEGDYSPENTRIVTNTQNYREAIENGKIVHGTGSNTPRVTRAYYVYDGKEFEKQDDLMDYTGWSRRWIQVMVRDGRIEKKHRVISPEFQFSTPYGKFNKMGECVQAARMNENPTLSRQTIWHRLNNPKYPDWFRL